MSHVVAGERLKKALSRSGREAGVQVEHVSEKDTRWSSCSFVGGRHELTLSLSDGGIERAWLDGLCELSFRIPDHVLVDLVVSTMERVGDRIVVVLDAMTVEEA